MDTEKTDFKAQAAERVFIWHSSLSLPFVCPLHFNVGLSVFQPTPQKPHPGTILWVQKLQSSSPWKLILFSKEHQVKKAFPQTAHSQK